METTVTASRSQGIKEGYLQDKKVILKPVPRSYPMIGDRKDHVLYFMQDGASRFFVLPRNEYNEFIRIFKDEDEMRFFSDILGIDLNYNKRDNNFWETFTVKITKDASFMMQGKSYDLSDPMDNLRIRLLKAYKNEVADGWENRYNSPKSKFCLVDEDFEDVESNKEMDMLETIYTSFGEMRTSVKKMKDFLAMYYMQKRTTKILPEDWTKDQLAADFKKIIDDDKITVYNLLKDQDSEIKLFITRGVRCGAIERKGVTGYKLPGEDNEYNFKEMVDYIKLLKEATDTSYIKIDTQIKQAKLN